MCISKEAIFKFKHLCISSKAFFLNGECEKGNSKRVEAQFLALQLGYFTAVKNKENKTSKVIFGFPDELTFFNDVIANNKDDLVYYFNQGISSFANGSIPLVDNELSYWKEVINKAASEASKSCGCLHDVYVSNFSSAINSKIYHLPEHEKVIIIELAKESEYASEEDLEIMENFNFDNDLCSHGIEPNCCPAGCCG